MELLLEVSIRSLPVVVRDKIERKAKRRHNERSYGTSKCIKLYANVTFISHCRKCRLICLALLQYESYMEKFISSAILNFPFMLKVLPITADDKFLTLNGIELWKVSFLNLYQKLSIFSFSRLCFCRHLNIL